MHVLEQPHLLSLDCKSSPKISLFAKQADEGGGGVRTSAATAEIAQGCQRGTRWFLIEEGLSFEKSQRYFILTTMQG